MIFREEFVADVVNCTAPDTQLRKPDDHDRHHDDGRIQAEPGRAEQAGKDDAYRKVADSHRKVAAKDTEDVA